MNQINIDKYVKNDIFWSQLFRGINNSYDIDYYIYKKKNSFNCSNQWYNTSNTIKRMKELNIKPCHKDHKCTGYSSCDNCYNYDRKKASLNNIKYIYSGNFKLDDEDDADDADDADDDENNDENNNLIDTNNFLNQITKLNLEPEQIKFTTNKKIKIINKCGFNDDHRGSNHTLIELPFVSEISLDNEFTLYDLLVSNTNLKSHKFDNWYEMYCLASCSEKSDTIIVKLEFDHGS